MKRCTTCKSTKPLSEFGNNINFVDGKQGICKVCKREKNKTWYKVKYANYKPKQDLSNKIWRDNNRVKANAEAMLFRAVLAGKVQKLERCESCNCEPEPRLLQGHHDDYALPLKVRWLCVSCHSQWHKDNGEGANAH